ncbi:MAG TPA: PAS domain-containing protein [Gammaproteobacteria bacterium]|nr:PAS domain-containing protein [Gammaproteobacteria bacterium]
MGRFGRISGLAIDAVVDDDALHAMCDELRLAFGAPHHLFVQLTGDPIQSSILDTTLSKSAIGKYVEHYSTVDLWAIEAMQRPRRSVVVNEELVPQKVFLDSEIYRDFIRPYADRVEHLMALTETVGPSSYVALSLLRTATARPFDSTEKRQLAKLAPTLRSVIRARMALRELLAEKDLGFAGLDALGRPIVIVNGAGGVEFANKAARQVAEENHRSLLGSVQRFSDLQLWFGRDSGRVTQAIQTVLAGAVPSIQLAYTSAADGASTVEVLRVPERHPGANRVSALLILRARTGERAPKAELLARLYGLSAAEAKVAIAIAKGTTLQGYADEHTLSIETVRSQVKAACRKLGVDRQIDLARMIVPLFE